MGKKNSFVFSSNAIPSEPMLGFWREIPTRSMDVWPVCCVIVCYSIIPVICCGRLSRTYNVHCLRT